MNLEVKYGLIELPGFDIGGKVLISDADLVTFDNDKGECIEAKSIKVVIEIEELADFINENCDELSELGFNVW
ncbi:MAG: hypothetical protein ACRCX2_34025 [Paraclostridium sp.]